MIGAKIVVKQPRLSSVFSVLYKESVFLYFSTLLKSPVSPLYKPLPRKLAVFQIFAKTHYVVQFCEFSGNCENQKVSLNWTPNSLLFLHKQFVIATVFCMYFTPNYISKLVISCGCKGIRFMKVDTAYLVASSAWLYLSTAVFFIFPLLSFSQQ